ncbi:MAG: NIF family HAD-type phosphatase [Myxococcota bacterium]
MATSGPVSDALCDDDEPVSVPKEECAALKDCPGKKEADEPANLVNLMNELDALEIGRGDLPRDRKTLVLLDFSDLLVKKMSGDDPKPRKPDFQISTGRSHYNNFYLRNGAQEFVKDLIQDPRCEVAIITSMKSKNMSNIMRYFDQQRPEESDDTTSILGSALHLFDRDFQAPDPDGVNSWDNIRDLTRIWAHSSARGFGPKNTVLVETEERKTIRCKSNAMIVNAMDVSVSDNALQKCGQELAAIFTDVVQGKSVPDILGAKALTK